MKYEVKTIYRKNNQWHDCETDSSCASLVDHLSEGWDLVLKERTMIPSSAGPFQNQEVNVYIIRRSLDEDTESGS